MPAAGTHGRPYHLGPRGPGSHRTSDDSLTPRQMIVLEIIVASLRTRHVPPTIREICDVMGFKSTNGAIDHLNALQQKGWIVRGDLKSRAMKLTEKTLRAISCPICGRGGDEV